MKESFSRIVCGAPSVRNALSLYAPAQAWWKIILALHGKPTDSLLSPAQKTGRVADGFRFYAWLYRFLAVIFFATTLTVVLVDAQFVLPVSVYWKGAGFLAAGYLWIVSGLGYAGAEALRRGDARAVPSLLSFMVMIVAFLSLFVGAFSVACHAYSWAGSGPNLLSAALLWVFGVGSYLIEIIYLATEQS